MLALTEKQYLIQAIGRLVCEEINKCVRPLVARVEQLEKMLGDMPVPASHDVVYASLAEHFDKRFNERVDSYIASLPPAKDGKDGKDGTNGVDGQNLSLDDVRDCLADLVAKAMSNIPVPKHCTGGYVDRDGSLHHTFSDGSIVDLGEVVGKDGKDCDMDLVIQRVDGHLAAIEKPKDGINGKDGVGFDDLQIEYDGERTVIFKFVKGDNRKNWNFILPIPLFRGIWKQGEYEKGDCVIRNYSMFIATKDTRTSPGDIHTDWQVCTKRGSDGKEGKQGPPGIDGKPGRDGRDLTQLGPDGSKW